MELMPGTSKITKSVGPADQASNNTGEDDKCPKKIAILEAETAKVIANINDTAPGINFTNRSDSSSCLFTSGIGGVMKQPISKNVETIPLTGFHYRGTLLAQRQHQYLRPQENYAISSVMNNYESLMPTYSVRTSGPNFWNSFNTAPASLIAKNSNHYCPTMKTIYGNSPSSSSFYRFNESRGTETVSKQEVANADGATTSSHCRVGQHNLGSSNNMQGLGKISKVTDFTPQKEKTRSAPLRKSARGMRCSSMKDKSESGCAPSKKQRNCKAPVLTSSRKSSPENTGEFDADHEDLLAAANSVNSARARACSNPFWKKMESLFAPVAAHYLPLLKRKGVATEGSVMRKIGKADRGLVVSTDDGGRKAIKTLDVAPSLFQRLLSAIIDEEESEESYDLNEGPSNIVECIHDDFHEARMKSDVQSEATLESGKCFLRDGLSGSACASAIMTSQKVASNTFCNDDLSQADGTLCGSGLVPSNSASKTGGSSKLHNDELRQADDGASLTDAEVLFGNDLDDQNAIHSPEVDRCHCEYQELSLNEKLSLELQSIGLSCGDMPHGCNREVGINVEIKGLQRKLHQQASNINNSLKRVDAALQCEQELERRAVEESAMDQLVQMAYKKIKVRRPHKASKQVALAFANRTLLRCKEFEESGRSCFSDPFLQDIILKRPPIKVDVKPADGVKRKREAQKNAKHKDLALGPVSGVIQKRASRSDKLRNSSRIQSPNQCSGFVANKEKEQLRNQISCPDLKAKEAIPVTQPGQVGIGVSNAEQPSSHQSVPSASYDPMVEKGKMKFLHEILGPASKVNLTSQLGRIHGVTITKNRDKREVAPPSTSGNVDKPKASSKPRRTLSRIGMLELAKPSQSSTVKPGQRSALFQ
ncbi:OLC1v1004590C1 [Oldenlandia corymbosa var. corymbosa]|uniref:OLC1v1004590C1 n=1 Tax=Oldenlandia corymbosa var. corymbosa TaxID=529605 RepID=A0AAV1DCV2_OLDCO|nr:OLC1v1004590C1 [Oldenlandia corymbosa var. corymbosa]